MWFDPAPGRTDPPPGEARVVAISLALFSFPVVLVAMTWLDPLAATAAAALRLQ
jgi:NADH-quinone oxidoreductase subunit N